MRAAAVLAAGLALVFAVGCVSVVRPASPGPTTDSQPTTPEAPTQAPTASPTEILVPVVTAPPLPTLEPNASPTIDARRFLSASVTVFNLSDFELSITAIIDDPEPGAEDVPVADFVLAPEQTTTRSVIGVDKPLPYVIEFSYPEGSSAVGGSCTLSVLAGEDFTFVAVNEGLTISRAGDTATVPDDLFIATSALCRPQPTPSATPSA